MTLNKPYFLDGVRSVGVRYLIVGEAALASPSRNSSVSDSSRVSLVPIKLKKMKLKKAKLKNLGKTLSDQTSPDQTSPDQTSPVLLFEGSAAAYQTILNYVSALRGVGELRRSGSTVTTTDYRYFDTFNADLRRNEFETYAFRQQQEVTGPEGRIVRAPHIAAVVRSPVVSGTQRSIEERTMNLDPGGVFRSQDPNHISALFPALNGIHGNMGGRELLMPVLELYVQEEIFRYQGENELKGQISVQVITAKFPVLSYPYKWYEVEVERIGQGENVHVRKLANNLVSAHSKLLIGAPESKSVKAMKLVHQESLDLYKIAAGQGVKYLEEMLAD